jgi:hypothetical protein
MAAGLQPGLASFAPQPLFHCCRFVKGTCDSDPKEPAWDWKQGKWTRGGGECNSKGLQECNTGADFSMLSFRQEHASRAGGVGKVFQGSGARDHREPPSRSVAGRFRLSITHACPASLLPHTLPRILSPHPPLASGSSSGYSMQHKLQVGQMKCPALWDSEPQ